MNQSPNRSKFQNSARPESICPKVKLRIRFPPKRRDYESSTVKNVIKTKANVIVN